MADDEILKRLISWLPIREQVRLGYRARETPLDPHLGLTPEQQAAVTESLRGVLNQHRHRKRTAIEAERLPDRVGMIVANALRSYERQRPTFYSRANGNYRSGIAGHPSYAGRAPTIGIIDALTVAGYLDSVKVRPGTFGKAQSTFIGTPKLAALVTDSGAVDLRFNYRLATRPTIYLKDQAKAQIEFEWTPELEAMAATVRTHNLFMAEQSIKGPAEIGGQEVNLFDPLHRVFNNSSFEEGGRFYGAAYQTLRMKGGANLRRLIRINNNETIELDYGAFQPRACYNILGIDYQSDPYDIPALNKLLKDDLTYEEIRSVAKIAMVILLNSDEGARVGYHAGKFKGMLGDGVRTAEIFECCYNHHRYINDLMYCRYGMTLMNIESNISNEIAIKSLEQQIPICVVHDSYVVEQHNDEWLRKSMEEAYMKQLGYKALIK